MLAGGCAASQAAEPSTLPRADGGADEAALRAELAAQGQRIGELETRLALLEEESRSARTAFKPEQTVRIGERRAAKAREKEEVLDDEEDSEAPASGLPVLRLTGQPRRPQPEPLTLPSPPPGVETRVPVVPLPEARARSLLASTGGAPTAAGDPKHEYGAALSLLSARRYDEALDAFAAFIAAHPQHRLTDNALYWRGMAHYALHRYGEAAREFEGVIERFPDSNKASESLLKLGMCHRRLGDEARAQVYFERVRKQYPNSDAARVASREGSS